MSLLRRRRLPEDLEGVRAAFLEAVEPVERAKQAVVEAVPQARYPGRDLGQALSAYAENLRLATGLMDAWRHPALETEWEACRRGLDEGLGLADRLGASSEALGFESLIEVVQELLDPLEAFATTEERFRDLRA